MRLRYGFFDRTFMMKSLPFISVMTLFLLMLSAGTLPYNMETLSVADGLGSNNVYAVVQDSVGYMWFGTDNGLDRYDGKTIRHYTHHSDDDSSLASSVVNCLVYSDFFGLLVGTESGLSRYLPGKDAFEDFCSGRFRGENIRTVFERDSTLWIGTNSGLYTVRGGTGIADSSEWLDSVNNLITGYLKKITELKRSSETGSIPFFVDMELNRKELLENRSFYNSLFEKHGIDYKIEGQKFRLNLVGRFNVSNALAAISVCMMMGIDKFEAAKALEGFTGIKRRLEVAGTNARNITLIDDFAHNASKIEASLAALKEYPGRLIVMYQSHKPFSARTTGKEDGVVFGKVLDKNDILLMPEIYMRDPVKDADISGADLVQYAVDNGVNAKFLGTKEKVREFILKNAKEGDRIVIMGARDNSLPDFSRQLLKDL